MKRVVGYARVSTDKQTKGVSLDAQRTKIEQYATLYDLELVDVIIDAGASAKTLERPGLRRALDRSRLDSLLDDDVRIGRVRSRNAMQSLISTIGRSLRWRGENGESHVGTAVGLEPSGALRVRLEKGRETIFHCGQVQHLRTLP